MRLFGYYAFHSFINQIKKLFKTWVLIFLVFCALIGALIGGGVAKLSDIADERAAETEILESDVYDDGDEDIPYTDEDHESILQEIDTNNLVELAIGGIILIVFIFELFNADKNGSKIFLPADVNLLFPSPLKPQSVLMFRLMTQIGMFICSSIYLLFQIPTFMSIGVSTWAIIAVIFTWLLTIVIGKLLQVLCYTVASTHVWLKQHLRTLIYACLIILAVGYFAFSKITGLTYLQAAAGFFNHPISRFIPLWGWLKGFAMSAVEGNVLNFLIYSAILLVSVMALITIIWRIKADFYEDAMAKSEETAQLLEVAKSEKSTGFVKRKKDRSDKIKRDGMHYGSGANVFFFRSLYNRFRFAKLGFLTKTTITYLMTTIAISCYFYFLSNTNGFTTVVLAIAAFTFYRTLGNPLVEDTSKDFFRMIPESTTAKLFWSLLGGTVNCLLDILPSIILAAIVFNIHPLTALAWIPFILSIDFYGSNVGAFIGLSVPVSAGTTIKQIVQVMFIYFGLLPAIAIMAIGIVYDEIVVAAIIAAIVSILLGLIFLGITPSFLEYNDKIAQSTLMWTKEIQKKAKKSFSRLGFGAVMILAVSTVFQFIFLKVFYQTLDYSWGLWIITFVPIYVIAIPIGLLLFKRVPKHELPKTNWKIGQMIKSIFICAFMMYFGALIGNALTALISSWIGVTYEQSLLTYMESDSLALKILFMSILAPLIEEYIFRKQLIDRMNIYGEKLAIFTSALMFGLFHGNLSQFFYAFGIGLVFSYIYTRTGKLRYSIGLHMAINLINGILSSELISRIDVSVLEDESLSLEQFAEALISPELIAYGIYLIAFILSALIGLALLCINARKLVFRQSEFEIPKGQKFKTAYVNVGMILFIIASITMIVLSMIQL